MTAKELLLQRAPTLTEEQAAAALRAVEGEPNGGTASDGAAPKKVGRLSFSGIGEADPVDGAKRFDELLGIAIDKRHPRS